MRCLVPATGHLVGHQRTMPEVLWLLESNNGTMTGRERFHETMGYGNPDHVPLFDEGIQDEVLKHWREQGLPADTDLYTLFHLDRHEMVPFNLEFHPLPRAWPMSVSELSLLQPCLDLNDPYRIPKDWSERVTAWMKRKHVVGLQVHRGFFLTMGVRDAVTFNRAIYQLVDAPQVVQKIMDLYCEFSLHVIDRVLEEVEVDFALFSEPIGGNEGPLLSPKTYKDFVLRSYLPIMERLRQRGVTVIIFRTYANARVLLRNVVDAGFDCLWAIETNPVVMNYPLIRREFGRALRLIGGIDLDSLLLGKEAIREEIMKNVPPLLAQGGYIPLADGRVRINVPYENYVYYRQLLAEVAGARHGATV